MPFPTPATWTKDTAEAQGDEDKRMRSPVSSFFAQGQALMLAGGYFPDARLVSAARHGVAAKHRHRVQLAIFGQLMAAFEFLLKDFVAQSIDATSLLDERVAQAKWIQLDVTRLLSHRSTRPSIGALLVHPTLGWHQVHQVNERYTGLFQIAPIAKSETTNLERLWILRHTVAHHASWLTVDDAVRCGFPDLGGRTVDLDAEFLAATFEFLKPIARRVATGGTKLLDLWAEGVRAAGPDWTRDAPAYAVLQRLTQVVERRAVPLATPTEAMYNALITPAPPGPGGGPPP